MKIEMKKVAKVLVEFDREDLFLKKFDKEAATEIGFDIDDIDELMFKIRLSEHIHIEHKFNLNRDIDEKNEEIMQILDEVFGISINLNHLNNIRKVLELSFEKEQESFFI